ncbi:MAG: hypothetical protein KJZ65_13125 [Phycisphaerales bacterium]|nr:hypothetical protein [Phycisphaerales bacterium]
MFEHRHEPTISRPAFFRRLMVSTAAAGGVVAGAIAIGVAGYHWIGGLGWVDSFLNACMILTGMGPVDRMESPASKVFSALYALFSGLVFLTTFAIIIAPVVHRLMHTFHKEGRRSAASG